MHPPIPRIVFFSAILTLFSFGQLLAQCPGVPWPATDALGRTLPLEKQARPLRRDRFVGIFYFLWHHPRDSRATAYDGPLDISRILALDPDALKKPGSPLWGAPGQAHYWGESLYGYYLSDDAWVIRRHAQLLADAGIDTLIFDTTNRATYKHQYLSLCKVFDIMRKAGERTPQIAFMVNTQAGQTADEIFHDLYEPGLHRELWFQWRGRPLLICDPAQASAAVREFFTLRAAHWPFKMVNTKDAWHWEATYPQVFGYTDDPTRPEQVNVSVAQNLAATPDGAVSNMSSGKARGRGFHEGRQDASSGAIASGQNFAEQWKRAIELDPPFVMITGWNEWIAGRFGGPSEPIAFVDQYDQQFSRDIEPMKGGHGDNFYYQMVDGIRRYKGVPPLPGASRPRTIHIGAGFAQWQDVAPEFRDHTGDIDPRDHDGVAGTHYKNDSGRNDLAIMKIAGDNQNVYFYLQATRPLQGGNPPANLHLLIDADQNRATGWEGYDLIVNRVSKDGLPLIEKNAGGWKWQPIDGAALQCVENQLALAIPRATLSARSFDFKWTDNIERHDDIMDVYLTGDAAPDARFNFRFIGE